MPLYDVYAVCRSCGTLHPMDIRVRLEDGPPDRMRLSDAYAGHELPPQVATLLNNELRCPETGWLFRPRDTGHVVLIPEE
jgi:hypothetical protein